MIPRRPRRAAVAATLGSMALAASFLMTPQASAEPDKSTVQSQVNTLLREAEVASENYNDAKIALHDAKRRLSALQADLDRERAAYDETRSRVAALVVDNYEGQTLSSTAQVLFSDDPDQMLAQLAVVVEYSSDQNSAMGTFVARARQLALREKAAQKELDAIAKTEKQLAEDKATIDDKLAQAKALLARLSQPPPTTTRTPAASRSSVRLPNVPASGRAKVAIDFALAQVGDVYSYGSAGPDAWDCSGLTMVAWGHAGVSLPHSSSAQAGYGRPVSASDLQPGDLVFYYSPISHVAIYIGNGKIVHAARPGEGVRISDVFSMPFSRAVRLG